MTQRILVVEDSQEWSELLSILLNNEHFAITTAASGRQALNLAAKNPPDAAVLDIRLPDTTGQQLCRELRALPGLDRLPIVALSSYPVEKVKSLELGVDAFVSKVTGQTELVPTLQALLRRVRMDTGVMEKGDLRLDPRGNAVFLGERMLASLTRKEFLFFYSLVKKSPEPASKADLWRQVMHEEREHPGSRALEMLVARLRKRLGKPLSDRIRGSRSFGWMYLMQQAPSAVPGKTVTA